MLYIIQKVLTAITFAAVAIGSNGYTQDALVNISTRGDIDPADVEALVAAGSSLIVGEWVIVRTFDESLANQGIAYPIADARFDVSELDLEDPANNHIIGQNDNWKDNGQPLQIVAVNLAPAADNHSAIVMNFDAGAYTPTAATVSSGIQHDEIDFGVNND